MEFEAFSNEVDPQEVFLDISADPKFVYRAGEHLLRSRLFEGDPVAVVVVSRQGSSTLSVDLQWITRQVGQVEGLLKSLPLWSSEFVDGLEGDLAIVRVVNVPSNSTRFGSELTELIDLMSNTLPVGLSNKCFLEFCSKWRKPRYS